MDRELVQAILDEYHKTRLSGDVVNFILSSKRVQDALWNYACAQMASA